MKDPDSYRIFRPRSLNNRSGRVIFPDLSKHNFSVEEKVSLCKIIAGDVDEFSEQMTRSDVCDRYKISVNTVKGWQSRFVAGKPLNAAGGCPNIFTAESEARIRDALVKNKQNYVVKDKRSGAKARFDRAQTKQLLNVEYQRSQQERRRSTFRSTANPKTIRSVIKKLNIKTGKSGTLTTARLKAGQNPRSAYSMYIMLASFSSDLDCYHKWNSDATQLTCKSNNNDRIVCYIDHNDDDDMNAQSLASTNFNGDLSIAVKWMHLNNAGGEVAPIVLIFAIPTMGENEAFIRKVVGLRNTAHPESYGYVIFSRTRAGNSKIWKWFFLEFGIPFIVACNNRTMSTVSFIVRK